MHDTAYEIGKKFFEFYALPNSTILDIGSCNVLDIGSSLSDFKPAHSTYIGVDTAPGLGVDLVVQAGAKLPIQDESADLIVASSILEHDRFFWNTFLELARVLKPGGALYINSPSNGKYHRYPVDCWRFYPDSGLALEQWAGNNGLDITLIESFTALRKYDIWNDFVAVYQKPPIRDQHDIRFLSYHFECSSAWRLGEDNRIEGNDFLVEDMLLIDSLRSEVQRLSSLFGNGDRIVNTEGANIDLDELLRRTSELNGHAKELRHRFLRLIEAPEASKSLEEPLVKESQSIEALRLHFGNIVGRPIAAK